MSSKYIAEGKGYGFIKDDGSIAMRRCFSCGKENYAPAVYSGACAWCRHDANGVKTMSSIEKNAVIKSARLNSGDYGLLTAWLDLDYGDSGQGFGGYSLYLPESYKHHKLESVAGHFIYRCMEIADVTSWDSLVGKTIRVRCTHSKINEIGHITKNDWFNPSKDFGSKDNE